ncbi:MAG: DnaB-like helicase N-terminal domain-containing protein [Cyclobacteriaceae bacterium]
MSLDIRGYSVQARLELENSIIGAVLLEDTSYGRIGRYLSPNNFSSEVNRLTWKSFDEMWSTKPINIRTMYHHLGVQHQVHAAHHLAQTVISVNSTASLEYWCLLLLELDIATKVSKMIEQTNFHPTETLVQQAAEEIYFKLIDSKEDLLVTIGDGAEYLHQVSREHPVAIKMNEFQKLISKRAERIKQNYPIRSLLENLMQLRRGGFREKMAIDHLNNMLLLVINGKPVSEDTMKKLVETKNQLAA